jgi:hypothetical protein
MLAIAGWCCVGVWAWGKEKRKKPNKKKKKEKKILARELAGRREVQEREGTLYRREGVDAWAHLCHGLPADELAHTPTGASLWGESLTV